MTVLSADEELLFLRLQPARQCSSVCSSAVLCSRRRVSDAGCTSFASRRVPQDPLRRFEPGRLPETPVSPGLSGGAEDASTCDAP